MQISEAEFRPSLNDDLLSAYVADLEIKVDRRRKQSQLIQYEPDKQSCGSASWWSKVGQH
jgi:hypothetical protein